MIVAGRHGGLGSDVYGDGDVPPSQVRGVRVALRSVVAEEPSRSG